MTFGTDIDSNEESDIQNFDRHLYSEYYTAYSIEEIPEKIRPYISNNNEVIQDISNSEVINYEETPKPLEGPIDSAWPMKCYDARHTSRSPYSTAECTGDELWRFFVDGWVEGTPVIANDGTIYFAKSWDLVAINPDGSEKWIYKTNGLILYSSPAIAEDGTIYVGSWDGGLYAINPDGTKKWRFPSGSNVGTSPVIANDGTIYFGNLGNYDWDCKFYAVHPNGTEKWHYVAGDSIYSDPCIGNDGTIYFGCKDKYFYAMNPNGTLKWRFRTGGEIYGSPSIAEDGTVYCPCSRDSFLYALYPNNGTMKWKYSGAGTPSNVAIGEDGTLYAGYLNRLVALNPNGTKKWYCYFEKDRIFVWSAPAISADGTIYIGTNIGDGYGGEIIAVNPDGTEKWRKNNAKYWVDSSPTIAEDGTVYIGCAYSMRGGYLHAFRKVESNSPPGIPSISGPTNPKIWEDNWYTFVAIDPDNHPIRLFVDWGDGNSGWIDWFASGETMWAEYAWNKIGRFTIRAKVKDEFGGESDWGYLEVSTPRNRATSNSLLLRLLERFPFLERFISHLMN